MSSFTSLVIIDRKGDEHVVEAQVGLSVMEVIRNNGFDELLALCGGSCSCATCHVYVDQELSASLPQMSEDENDLLDGSDYRDHRSRLSCQIPFSEALDGMRVEIAPEG
ncbi:Ferredoxin-6 [Pseudomonas fluorescens]|uniref:Ferredoxin-6 n=1 Tax=Pseudomonas fluorescens TaxID=294 RepID=A0A8H2RHK4_PSEFL|nr:2Fe-2S iron-sulfur cluster-binding protein [Pseudomonas fluorescens]VVO58812.1 Ferredoxin-6 [Pseudomonas fluorescens]